ncbi:MAG: tryptophan--tRNA ligase [Spirochaetaceae bacterium]|jgi:tryptophanyl-tRNA synthetase|nr:tryptophan--tRNA ligase [Spirochaetaceae bacterium]
MKKISLTGIKPTGSLHIGNYFGAIKPALELCERFDARYFIADYHALNTMKDAQSLRRATLEIAALWLACGLNPEKTVFYRQSLVPETFELSTILAAFTSKGLMNRAHAYKAAVEANTAKGNDPDSGINMGLFTYPVLMAADILLFNADYVPVGRDQTQHVEMARDIADVINHTYNKELLTLPQAWVHDSAGVIPGLDGRKMSKSYGNVIALSLPEKELRKTIMRVVTNSQGVDEPKDTENCRVFALYKLFSASKEDEEALAKRYRSGGMGWGEAKEELFNAANRVLKPIRERYENLISNPQEIDRILREGSQKAREIASQTISRLRNAIGL